MNEYTIGTIVGSALLSLAKRGSKTTVKKEPYIMVIPGKWWEITIDNIPQEIIHHPEQVSLYGRVHECLKKFELPIPQNEKEYISKVEWNVDVHTDQLPNPELWAIKIYLSPHVLFQPNVFTDWRHSTATRKALNYMFMPDDDLANIFDYLYSDETGGKLEQVIEQEFTDIINHWMAINTTVWSTLDDELDDSDDSFLDESWENRYENSGDGAISVYDKEKFVFYNKEGRIVEPPSTPKSKLRRR